MNNSTTTDEWDFDIKLGKTANIFVGTYLLLIGGAAIAVHVYLCKRLRQFNTKLLPLDKAVYPLVVYDILMLTLFPMPIISCFSNRWIFGKTGCVVYGFFGFLFGLGNMSTLVLLAITKYVKICHWDAVVIDNATTLVLTAVALGYTLIWSICPFVGFGAYGLEPNPFSCSVDWTKTDGNQPAFLITILTFGGVIPFAVICFCYSSIIRKCRQSFGHTINDRRKRVYKYWMLISFGYIICWGPYAIVGAISAGGFGHHLPYLLHTVPGLFAKTTVLIDPLIYIVHNKRLRSVVIRGSMSQESVE